jgi:hypothetical protein
MAAAVSTRGLAAEASSPLDVFAWRWNLAEPELSHEPDAV